MSLRIQEVSNFSEDILGLVQICFLHLGQISAQLHRGIQLLTLIGCTPGWLLRPFFSSLTRTLSVKLAVSSSFHIHTHTHAPLVRPEDITSNRANALAVAAYFLECETKPGVSHYLVAYKGCCIPTCTEFILIK